jgi:UDP-N-acetyl-D-galactosamine dehydrogenase
MKPHQSKIGQSKIGESKIAIIGLGYVGLPLAVEFAKQYPTIGFDIMQSRIDELKTGKDSTLEVEPEELKKLQNIRFTGNPEDIRNCNVYIVTVPTPIDEDKEPDLTPLQEACKTVGEILKKDDLVIFESTVFPGATEEVCALILEHVSGLVYNRDFFLGYSPERINPGDKTHRITDISKLTAGSTAATAEFVDQLYGSIITAGTHKVSSIRVAEAAKVIENTQRDVNIALVNELARLFDKLDLDTEEVLLAAGTKWNFLNFRPGLVGGHCIGVDPYYLTHRAIQAGYDPQMILAGRRLNDSMADFVVDKLVRKMSEVGKPLKDANILVMGVTFKENCPDTRNSQVFRIIESLREMQANVDATDPWVSTQEAEERQLVRRGGANQYDVIVIAVAHRQFKDLGMEAIRGMGRGDCIVFDLKYLFDQQQTDIRL